MNSEGVMKDLVCVECDKEFRGVPPGRLSTDKSPESNVGICPECFEAHLKFSDESMEVFEKNKK